MHPSTSTVTRTAAAVSFALLYCDVSRDLEATLRYTLRNAQDAADAAQETWARAWAHWHELQQHPQPRAWLFRTAHNCALDAIRRRRTVSVSPFDDTLAAPESHLESQVAEREIFATIFAELSHDQLRAFALALAGYSAATTPGLDKMRVSRARAHLRLAYARETAETSAASAGDAASPDNIPSLAPGTSVNDFQRLPPGQLRQLQREFGICSMPDCPMPIAGWCSTCDALGPFKAPKLCQRHLDEHLARHAGHVPFYPYAHREGGMPA